MKKNGISPPFNTYNKIKLEIRESAQRSIAAISNLGDYMITGLSLNPAHLITDRGGIPSAIEMNSTKKEGNVHAMKFLNLIQQSPPPSFNLDVSITSSEEQKYTTTPISINSFNWIHYLLLNEDLIENNIITENSAFEHWTNHGIKERRQSMIQPNLTPNYVKTYMKLKDKNPNCHDDAFEKNITFRASDLELFQKYPVLFHKYLLNLRDPHENMTYNVTKFVEIERKNICSIHCYDLNVFDEYFGKYLDEISNVFDIIVTYCIHNDTVLLNHKYLFICMKNKGMDLGGKFVTVDYLKSHKINYDYLFFMHSKTDKYMRNNYIAPFYSNLNKINDLLQCGEVGGIFPNELLISYNDLNIIDSSFFNTINNLKYEKITWGINAPYVKEMNNYFGIQSESYIFASGNFYILHKSIADTLFGDKYIYNVLNTTTSFDYNWVNVYYGLRQDPASVYKKYRVEKLIGNYLENAHFGKRTADAMIEHSFERVVLALVLQTKKPVRILNVENFEMSTIEKYMNNSCVKKNKETDFLTIKEYMHSKLNDFDWEMYLISNPDLIDAGIKDKKSATKHWYSSGIKEGRKHTDPNFDWEIYLLLNPDLIDGGIKDKKGVTTHWYSCGIKEGRKYTDPNFDWEIYLLLNKDLQSAKISTRFEAFQHWTNHGKKEGRILRDSNFDWKDYISLNRDLEENGINTETLAYKHWIQLGKSEGRKCKIDCENASEFDWKF